MISWREEINFIKTPRAESSSTVASTIILPNSKVTSPPHNISCCFRFYWAQVYITGGNDKLQKLQTWSLLSSVVSLRSHIHLVLTCDTVAFFLIQMDTDHMVIPGLHGVYVTDGWCGVKWWSLSVSKPFVQSYWSACVNRFTQYFFSQLI